MHGVKAALSSSQHKTKTEDNDSSVKKYQKPSMFKSMHNKSEIRKVQFLAVPAFNEHPFRMVGPNSHDEQGIIKSKSQNSEPSFFFPVKHSGK